MELCCLDHPSTKNLLSATRRAVRGHPLAAALVSSQGQIQAVASQWLSIDGILGTDHSCPMRDSSEGQSLVRCSPLGSLRLSQSSITVWGNLCPILLFSTFIFIKVTSTKLLVHLILSQCLLLREPKWHRLRVIDFLFWAISVSCYYLYYYFIQPQTDF